MAVLFDSKAPSRPKKKKKERRPYYPVLLASYFLLTLFVNVSLRSLNGGRGPKALLLFPALPVEEEGGVLLAYLGAKTVAGCLEGAREGGRRREEGGRRKEEGGRRREEGGRRKEEGGRRKEEGKEEGGGKMVATEKPRNDDGLVVRRSSSLGCVAIHPGQMRMLASIACT